MVKKMRFKLTEIEEELFDKVWTWHKYLLEQGLHTNIQTKNGLAKSILIDALKDHVAEIEQAKTDRV